VIRCFALPFSEFVCASHPGAMTFQDIFMLPWFGPIQTPVTQLRSRWATRSGDITRIAGQFFPEKLPARIAAAV
jgi:hypothetical protein